MYISLPHAIMHMPHAHAHMAHGGCNVGALHTHPTRPSSPARVVPPESTIINGHPSGRTVAFDDFSMMVRDRYGGLLQVEQYRFVGDASAWQTKQGREKMTAEKARTTAFAANTAARAACSRRGADAAPPSRAACGVGIFRVCDGASVPHAPWSQEYLLEVRTRGDEHLLVKFRLVYDWLLHCHLVSMVTVVRARVPPHAAPRADGSARIRPSGELSTLLPPPPRAPHRTMQLSATNGKHFPGEDDFQLGI